MSAPAVIVDPGRCRETGRQIVWELIILVLVLVLVLIAIVLVVVLVLVVIVLAMIVNPLRITSGTIFPEKSPTHYHHPSVPL